MECICEICDCGLHQCPSEPLTLKVDSCKRMTTEYDERFQTPEGSTRVSAIKQKENLNQGTGGLSIGGWGLPFNGVTSNNVDFIAHQVEPRYVHPVKKYEPTNEQMETGTSYSNAFLGVFLEGRTKPAEVISKLTVGSGPMELTTTYRSEFFPKRANKCPASCSSIMTGYKFEQTDLGHRFFSKKS